MRQRSSPTFIGRSRIARSVLACICFLAIGLPQPSLARGRGVLADFADLPADSSVPAAPALPHLNAASNTGAIPAAVQLQQEYAIPDAAACSKLTAGATTWFAADADGNVDTDKPADSYASGVTILAPGFKYTCVPKDTDIVVIIYNESYGDQPALVDKRTLHASPTAGVFFYGLTTPDGLALQDGKWRVAFYLGKTPLTTGEILVGGATSMDATQQALLQGTITDLRTGQPVAGARIFVLNPGVTIANFTHDTNSEDIYAQTRSDDQGQYSLWKPVQRNTAYAMLIAADGYKLRGANNLTVGDDAETPVTLDIQVIKK